MELDRAIGRIEGALQASTKNVDEKFVSMVVELKGLNKKIDSIDKRVISLETDRRVVTKLAGVVGTLASVITTSLITIGIRLIS